MKARAVLILVTVVALSTRRPQAQIRSWLAALAAAVLLAALATGPASAAAAPAAAADDPTVVSDWNAIAVTTLAGDTTKQLVEDFLYMGFVQAAVYDAVVGVEGRYAPYRFHAHAPHGTSAQAAAVAAAHKVLVTYVPTAQASLDAAYAASLAKLPDGKAKTRGIAFGARAADHLIRLRAHDGRNAPILFTKPPAPGVWRPTPPAFLPMSAPWVGFVRPLLVRSATQFAPPPPPALTSARYTRDFNEVKAFGSSTSTERTLAQTSTALFFSGNALVQYNAGLRDQVTVRHLDIVDAARMFAAIDMSLADAEISVWHAKYVYGYWRPITAINLADHRDQPGRYRWQPGHGRRSQLGATADDTPIPRVPERVQHGQLDRDPRSGGSVPHPASAADADLHGGARRPPLRLRPSAPQGRGERPGVVGDPLPLRRYRLQGDGEAAHRLDA
jgi:hypothetical protein